eukprot:Hpha_TRINITY_DN16676_c1_g4::TRINITY_DN16676_c1_g4_i1::g.182844::m.182844
MMSSNTMAITPTITPANTALLSSEGEDGEALAADPGDAEGCKAAAGWGETVGDETGPLDGTPTGEELGTPGGSGDPEGAALGLLGPAVGGEVGGLVGGTTGCWVGDPGGRGDFEGDWLGGSGDFEGEWLGGSVGWRGEAGGTLDRNGTEGRGWE